MKHFMEEYGKRKSEIEAYLKLVSIISSDNVEIKNDSGDTHIITTLESTTLKASFYLVLYNLVEATVREGIRSIYNKIADDGISFPNLNQKLQEVWWYSHQESITATPRDALISRVYEVYCLCRSDSSPGFQDFIAGVSGNMDAEGVRSVCRKYGIDLVDDGRDLKKVKDNRNWLSHGNKSFSEVGKDSTPSELKNAMNQVMLFLDKYVTNVTDYLDNSKYKLVI
ncbi:MAE_28990/MAE_18760 family HEPN-like nuclease [Stutzerimonas nitrititolerans]|uniref:MAE_28990/MAE_18760 family HEPN-like nuclease n=1 Tax=Stutzerimonas nitrititolerans TaxID=2482751 RepID=UPI0028AE5697|nr:MAE_28990/MAE_18760 family HEPN-like nuclease [Stutzerimonas nitrititolerans]